MARLDVSYRWVGDAMRNDKVRRALDAKARQVKARADQIAASEGVRMTTEITSGTRPKGRPYSRVESPDGAGQEWGTARTPRRRVLGRAGDG